MNVGTSTSTQGSALAEGRSGVQDPFADRDNDADANADALALIKRLAARCRSPLLDRPIVHYEGQRRLRLRGCDNNAVTVACLDRYPDFGGGRPSSHQLHRKGGALG